jgi:hypothetical protein
MAVVASTAKNAPIEVASALRGVAASAAMLDVVPMAVVEI